MPNTDANAARAPGFGPMLRNWSNARGASQLDLARTCGLSQRHLSCPESGSRPRRRPTTPL